MQYLYTKLALKLGNTPFENVRKGVGGSNPPTPLSVLFFLKNVSTSTFSVTRFQFSYYISLNLLHSSCNQPSFYNGFKYQQSWFTEPARRADCILLNIHLSGHGKAAQANLSTRQRPTLLNLCQHEFHYIYFEYKVYL